MARPNIRGLGLAAAGLTAAAVLPASTAEAGVNWQPTWTPENLGHYFLQDSSLAGGAVDAFNNGADEANRTTANVFKTGVGGAWNDVLVKSAAVPNGNAADWHCVTQWVSGSGRTHCDVSMIRYTNSGYFNNASTAYWKAVGCHEAAHSLGLGERPQGDASCDRNPASGDFTLLGWDSIHFFDDNYVV